MLSATLNEGRKDYAIGAKIRALRLKKKKMGFGLR